MKTAAVTSIKEAESGCVGDKNEEHCDAKNSLKGANKGTTKVYFSLPLVWEYPAFLGTKPTVHKYFQGKL